MVALLWFYVTSLAILIGAQLDATIERVTIDPRSKPKAATSCKLRRGKTRRNPAYAVVPLRSATTPADGRSKANEKKAHSESVGTAAASS